MWNALSRVVMLAVFWGMALGSSFITFGTLQTVQKFVKERGSKADWAAKYTVYLTGFSSLCFSIGLLISAAAHTQLMDTLGWTKDSVSKSEMLNDFEKINPFIQTWVICQIIGFLCLISVCFERMKSIWDGSRLSLHSSTVFKARVCIAIYGILNFSIFVIEFTFDNVLLLVGAMSLISFLMYATLSTWIGYTFWTNTKKLLKDSSLFNHSINNNNNSGNNNSSSSLPRLSRNSSASMRSEHSRLHDFGLLEPSIRLSIITVFALMSTLLGILSVLIYAVNPSYSLFIVRSIGYGFDAFSNTFTLMCTFKDRRHYYYLMFGYIHRFWLHYYHYQDGGGGGGSSFSLKTKKNSNEKDNHFDDDMDLPKDLEIAAIKPSMNKDRLTISISLWRNSHSTMNSRSPNDTLGHLDGVDHTPVTVSDNHSNTLSMSPEISTLQG